MVPLNFEVRSGPRPKSNSFSHAYHAASMGESQRRGRPRSVGRSIQSVRESFDEADRKITGYMDRVGVPVLRIALGIVFVWFGGLKIIGGSPVSTLVGNTVYLLEPELVVPILGVWEALIGLCLLYRPFIRIGIVLLFVQMPGTFLPIVLLPDVVFATFPHQLTVEGQYIVKNLVIIGAALVIGGSVRDESTSETVGISDRPER